MARGGEIHHPPRQHRVRPRHLQPGTTMVAERTVIQRTEARADTPRRPDQAFAEHPQQLCDVGDVLERVFRNDHIERLVYRKGGCVDCPKGHAIKQVPKPLRQDPVGERDTALVQVNAEHRAAGLGNFNRHGTMAATDLENPFARPIGGGPEPPPILFVGLRLPFEVLQGVLFGFAQLDVSRLPCRLARHRSGLAVVILVLRCTRAQGIWPLIARLLWQDRSARPIGLGRCPRRRFSVPTPIPDSGARSGSAMQPPICTATVIETESQTMRADFDQFTAINRFGSLDGLRALSVIAVVWHHTSGTPGPSISAKGFLGVDFFFAISGFLITTLLVREQREAGRISLRKFYTRRAIRIFPLYYATLLIYLALVAVMRRNTAEGEQFFHNLPAFATYTSNWFVDLTAGNSVTFYFAWSLATEEQFYLLWPPLLVAALAIGRRHVWVPLTVLAALIAVSQGVRLAADPTQLPWRIVASLSLPILLASAAAVALDTPRGFAVLGWLLGRIWSAPAAALVLTLALATSTPQQLTQCLMVAVVVSTCLLEWTPLHPLLGWRPLAFVGVISYGVYLLHMLCANLDRQIIRQEYGIPLAATTLATVVLAAHLSFRYFETPLLRFKRRFTTMDQRQGDELSRITGTNPVPTPGPNRESTA